MAGVPNTNQSACAPHYTQSNETGGEGLTNADPSILAKMIIVNLFGQCPPTMYYWRSRIERAFAIYEVGDMSDRQMGTVKWFNDSKGFGFIERESGEDVFVHFRSIRGDGFRTLKQGARVEFSITQTDKGFQAEDVDQKDD